MRPVTVLSPTAMTTTEASNRADSSLIIQKLPRLLASSPLPTLGRYPSLVHKSGETPTQTVHHSSSVAEIPADDTHSTLPSLSAPVECRINRPRLSAPRGISAGRVKANRSLGYQGGNLG